MTDEPDNANIPANLPDDAREEIRKIEDQNINIGEEDDFPVYANEANKRLNKIIREKTKLLNQFKSEAEVNIERIKILEEHLKSVSDELVHTQKMIDNRNKEIESEDHLKQIAERATGRFLNEIKNMDGQSVDLQDRLNNLQNMIFKANESIDKYKLEMNWNQEELEQWALAARQKEEDNLTLEKYERADEAKIKELNLQVEKLTIEVARKKFELDKEITETQAAQIELNKTAEEFKIIHSQRHELYQQWEEILENSKRREEQIQRESEQLYKQEQELGDKKAEVMSKRNAIDKDKAENNARESQIVLSERLLSKLKEEENQAKATMRNLEDNYLILKNQLAAFASEQALKRSHMTQLYKELENAKQRLDFANKKLLTTQNKLKKEQESQYTAAQANQKAEKHFKKANIALAESEKAIRSLKEVQFKKSQELLKLREQQASLIGEISGALSAKRNLEAKLKKLQQEKERQDEVLYNADYNIQQMERKLSKVTGERGQEETKKKEDTIKDLENQLKEKVEEYDMLEKAIKKLSEDDREILRSLDKAIEEKKVLESMIQELRLQNEMMQVEYDSLIKKKEAVLLSHDVMKLEVRKIKDAVKDEADKVVGLENKKSQLEMSLEEREKEINVHKEILNSELKCAEEERHKVAVELQERKNRVKNLKIKYEGLIEKNKSSSEDGGSATEHSQAYYVIKAAQEREELQRYVDDLDGKIKKCEKGLRALTNTLEHLKKRNHNYREKLSEGIMKGDLEKKNLLEEQCRAASEALFKKRKEMTKLQKEFEDENRRMLDYQAKMEALTKMINENKNLREKLDKDINAQQANLEQAHDKVADFESKVGKELPLLKSDSPSMMEIEYETISQKTNGILSVLKMLGKELPEINEILKNVLERNQQKMPSRPLSEENQNEDDQLREEDRIDENKS